MKLLLTSNGFTPTIAQEFLKLLATLPEVSRVGFITTAAFGEVHDPTWDAPAWLEEYRNQLRILQVKQIEDVDLKDKTVNEVRNALADKNIIFVNGGNTFYLNFWSQKSNFSQVVKEFLDRGGLYVGVSAGSIITNPTVETCTWEPADENRIGLTDLAAMNLVQFFIHPHFETVQQMYIEEKAQGIAKPLIALTNEQAIVVAGDKQYLVGEGDKHLFNGFQERK